MHSFSVAISWGNKMNFSLYAKDVRILLRQSQIMNAKKSNIYGLKDSVKLIKFLMQGPSLFHRL